MGSARLKYLCHATWWANRETVHKDPGYCAQPRQMAENGGQLRTSAPQRIQPGLRAKEKGWRYSDIRKRKLKFLECIIRKEGLENMTSTWHTERENRQKTAGYLTEKFAWMNGRTGFKCLGKRKTMLRKRGACEGTQHIEACTGSDLLCWLSSQDPEAKWVSWDSDRTMYRIEKRKRTPTQN